MIFMLIAPIVLAVQSSSDSIELKSRIVDASVFKSGLVMLNREVTVPAGDGIYMLDVVPEAIDGSFWYSSPDGLLVTDVETTLRFKDEKVKIPAQTVGDYLAANVGNRVKVVYRSPAYGQTPPKAEQIEGVVNGLPRPQSNIVPVKLDNGHLINLSISSIEEIDTNGLKAESFRTVKTPDLRIKFRAHVDKPSRLDFVTMESGAAWVGNYLVKLQQNGSTTVVGKAQIGLGALAFDETNVKVIAGQPRLFENGRFDLASGVGPLSAFLDHSQDSFLAYRSGVHDPYTLIAQYANEASSIKSTVDQGLVNYDGSVYRGGFGGGGGMGGGGFGGPGGAGFSGDTLSTMSNRRQLATQAPADRLESLYSYPVGKVSLSPGDRLSRILFSQASTYENLFRWQAEVGNDNGAVKNLLRIHNTGTIPWTGGPVLVTKDDSPVAQAEMPFTAGSKFADIELATSQDILTKKEEFEVSRDSVPMPSRPKFSINRTTNEVHLSIESSRIETTKFELTLLVPGEIIDPNGGKVDKLLRRQDQWNGQSQITWNFNLGAGDKREVKIQYRRLG